MVSKIIFHPKANIDVEESYYYYYQTSKDLAELFLLEIDKILETLTLNPIKGRIIKSKYRIILTKKFPFQIIYTYNKANESVSIISVYHNSRNPKKKFRRFKK